MAKGRLFRIANIYLLLAGLLSGALLFAPLAYASNFSTKTHASIYGTWVVIDEGLGAGMDFERTKYLPQLPLHYPYAVLGGVICIGLLGMVFFNRDQRQKRKRIRLLLILAVAHAGAGVLLRVLALQHVGASQLAGHSEAGFQREYLLHFFVLYFLWRVFRNLPLEAAAPGRPQAAAPATQAGGLP